MKCTLLALLLVAAVAHADDQAVAKQKTPTTRHSGTHPIARKKPATRAANAECKYRTPSVQETCRQMQEYYRLEEREDAHRQERYQAAQRRADEIRSKYLSDVSSFESGAPVTRWNDPDRLYIVNGELKHVQEMNSSELAHIAHDHVIIEMKGTTREELESTIAVLPDKKAELVALWEEAHGEKLDQDGK